MKLSYELKPCPFCGGPALMDDGESEGDFNPYCAASIAFGGCPVNFDESYETRELAIAAWNTRPIESAVRSQGEADRRDAERYRRLRENWISCDEIGFAGRLAVIDVAVDAAMRSQQGGEGDGRC